MTDSLDRRVAIIGLGYVGLPLGLALMDAGLAVVGYDSDSDRLAQLRAGRSPVADVTDDRLKAALVNGLGLRAPGEDGLADADTIFVCVSTPINAAREPDLTAVMDSATAISQSLRRGQLVVLQSTTWPGTTAGPFRELLESGSGLQAGADFGLAFAPERISPGDADRASVALPRVVGGLTAADTARAIRSRIFSDLGSTAPRASRARAS